MERLHFSPRELGAVGPLEGDQVFYAGGNGVLGVLGSPAVSMGAGMAPMQPTMAGPAQVTNTAGNGAPLGHVQIATAALLLLSLAALVFLNKAGFRFSVTVGS